MEGERLRLIDEGAELARDWTRYVTTSRFAFRESPFVARGHEILEQAERIGASARS